MRCAIYTRVSTDEQTQPEYGSLQTQQEICEHYIQVHREKDWKLAQVYEDGGYSGKDLDRPAMQQLLYDVGQGNIEVVIAYKLDRISRSLKDFYDFWQVLKDHSVTFVSATQNFDTSDSAGNLMLNILLSFAQYERELTMERTATKMKARAEKGLWNGGWVPLGYDYTAEQQLLVPNPQEAKVVRKVFDLVIRHGKLSKVRNELNSVGHRTKSRIVTTRSGQRKQVGNNRFSFDAIKSIVENPAYKGLVRYQNQLYPGMHKPLVSEEVWEDANTTLAKYKPRRKLVGLMPKDDYVHLLKGLIKCGDCASTMTPYPAGKKDKRGRPYLYYTCTKVVEHGQDSKCRVRSLPARKFEHVIKEALSDIGKKRAVLEECVRQADLEAGTSLAPLCEKRDQYNTQLAVLTREIKRLIGIFKSQDGVPEDLKQECLELDRQKQHVKTELEKLEIEINWRKQRVVDLDIIQRSLQDFSRLIEVLALEDQKELMQLLIEEIVVSPYDPERQKPPSEEGALTTQIRTKHYKVNIKLHQIPDLVGSVNHSGQSSENEGLGSPYGTIIGTFSEAMSAWSLHSPSSRNSRLTAHKDGSAGIRCCSLRSSRSSWGQAWLTIGLRLRGGMD